MECRGLASGGGAVREIALDGAREIRHVRLEHAGALCASDRCVFCACGDVIWRLERKSLMPQTLFAGGPGVCQMLLSKDQERLYALCAEADSVLMLCEKTGEPMLVNRAGVNPRQMALEGDTLAIAGGESGYVLLLCARSLQVRHALSMPGPVYSVALCAEYVYALCLTPSLSSVLVTTDENGKHSRLFLSGMPGRLLIHRNALLIQTEGMLYAASLDGREILQSYRAPGRAAWLHDVQDRLLMLDAYSDSLFFLGKDGWRMAASGVSFAACPDT